MTLLNFHRYGKIKTLFKRNDQGELIDEWSHPVVGAISCWNVYEQIDGMSIRIDYLAACDATLGRACRFIRERSDKSEIPCDLFEYLETTFTIDRLQEFFGDEDGIIYGEGIGPMIQGGNAKGYEKNELIAFDIVQGGKWRNDRSYEFKEHFNVRWVPYFGKYGIMYRDSDIDIGNFESWKNYNHMHNIIQWSRYRPTCDPSLVEGFIFRPQDRTERLDMKPADDLTLYDEHGNRVIFKLKRKDVFSDTGEGT